MPRTLLPTCLNAFRLFSVVILLASTLGLLLGGNLRLLTTTNTRSALTHIHTGGHAITAFDLDQFLAFADSHLR
jgi:hypothetical protein